MFRFTTKQAKNWHIMLDALRDAKEKGKRYNISDYTMCPCGLYLRYINKYNPYYIINDVILAHFGVKYDQYSNSKIEKFFTANGPETLTKAIQQGELLLKNHAPITKRNKSHGSGAVNITTQQSSNSVLFTDLDIGQVFRYDGKIWMKSFTPDNPDDFAVCLNDGCNGIDWRGYFVELVNIEVVVS